ncbi:MAG: putative bifunctional diguanylate cyclase/phosphodiesterase [Candidatus Wenzhouxiangella sp. M2_3B_020]
MKRRRRHILYSAPSRVPWLIALVLLALLLVATVMLSNAFRETEDREIERYLDSVVTHIENDLLDSALQHTAIQGRMATRLAFDGPFDQAAWRADAVRLMADHEYYRMLAVLDADYVVRWVAGEAYAGITPGNRFPLSVEALARLGEPGPAMTTIVLEPFAGARRDSAMLFMTPVVADGGINGWLAAVMSLSDTIRSMLTGFYLQDIVLDIGFADANFTIPADGDARRAPGYRRSIVFELGDRTSELEVDVSLRAAKVDELRSGMPTLILVLGSALAVLLVVAALLAMAAARQARVLAGANRNLKNEIRDRELAEQELEFLLTHDSLTDLPNRQGMLRLLESSINELADGQCLAVFFIDLDQFKDINETLGHHLGDELLRQVPDRLARELDDDDRLGRLGGDEYLVIVERADRERIGRLADNLLGAMEKPFRVGEHQLFISASIGVAYLDSTTASPGELIQNADAALYRAKQLGRNQHATFSPEMFAQVEYRLHLSRDIRQALDDGEFRMVYQPIVRLDTLDICGVEALMRWPHADGYNVPPRDFIRVAEETGVVQRLSRYALEKAVRDLAAWQRRFDNAPWLAVNISGAQFREADFVRDMSVLLHKHRIDPDCVHLEITEEVLIENLARNRQVLEELDGIGMPIVVDDFGIGYSSLAYIKNFPISTIKIDQGFVRGLENDADDRAITRTICALSHELSMKTVAEGIEHTGQLELLRGFGCDMGQGFLFMQPSSAETITRILAGDVPWAALGREAAEEDHAGRQQGGA